MKFLYVLLFLIFCSPAFACKCPVHETEFKFNNSDIVYFGKIIESKLLADNQVKNTLEVIEVFKGKPNTLVFSAVSESRCSTPSAVGLTYIVYGKNNSDIQLGLCSFTQPHNKLWANNYNEELTMLRELANRHINEN